VFTAEGKPKADPEVHLLPVQRRNQPRLREPGSAVAAGWALVGEGDDVVEQARRRAASRLQIEGSAPVRAVLPYPNVRVSRR
jgi:hypothetical protein